ncbi:MAG: hypothetical protein AAF490_31350 [Chloroflexota bacterium]
MKQYEGHYQLDDMVVKVGVIDEQLTIAFSGVPPGFEVILDPLKNAHHFKMNGGPVDGATAVFHFRDQDVPEKVMVGDVFELLRVDGEAGAVHSGHGLLPPKLNLTDNKVNAFSALTTGWVHDGQGDAIDWQLPYPKYEFLQYLAMQEQFIFHGSNNRDIEEFSTRRTSLELKDRSGRGNKQAVYGTHDGLWPMFFAIVDRPNLTGSIRNGVMFFKNQDGEEQAVYHFSVNKDILEQRPYTQGALYILPRQTFEQIPIADGALSNEWASEVPVKPLAKLYLEPEDFPFLEQIGGHDDSELIRASDLTELLVERVAGYYKKEAGFALKLNWDDAYGQDLIEFILIQRKLMPTAQITLRFEGDQAVWYEMQGPPAYEQVWHDRLIQQGKPIIIE